MTVQSVCNAQAIRIPWADVARTMGHNASEGAIVQHLAKLRTRRADAGKEVPPPLRRSAAVTSSASSALSSRGNTISKSRETSKSKPTRQSDMIHPDPDREGEAAMNYDCDRSSDDDYGKTSRKRASKRKRTMSTTEKLSFKHNPEDTHVKHESDTDGFATDGDEGSPDKLLVPGASFLKYPNDKKAPSLPSSPGPAKSCKVIVLKYKAREQGPGRERGEAAAQYRNTFDNDPEGHQEESFFNLLCDDLYQDNSNLDFVNPIDTQGLTASNEAAASQTGYSMQIDPLDQNAVSLGGMAFQSFLPDVHPQFQNHMYPSQFSGIFCPGLLGPGDTSFTGNYSSGPRYHLGENIGMNEGF